MNLLMVARLIGKDWYFEQWVIRGAMIAGAATLAWVAMGGTLAWIMGIIMIVTVMIGIGAQLAIASIVYERKDQTLAFVMSLPISYREYTASKVVGNLLIFLAPWLVLVAGIFAVLLYSKNTAHGLLPFAAIMAVEILASSCLIAATAVVTESQGWTIGAILVGNLAVNAIGYWVAHVPEIAAVMKGTSVRWPTVASEFLLGEFGFIALVIALTFFFQSQKRDFL